MNYLHNRFKKETNKMAQEYTASIPFDQRLYRQDIEGSTAHVKILTNRE
jgi:argininosuccinate lyase